MKNGTESVGAVLRRLPAPAVALTIWFLSAQSSVPLPRVFGMDKLAHCIAYGGFALMVALWMPVSLWRSHVWRVVFIITGISVLYGITDELHQYFVPGRDCSIFDLTADAIGGFSGALIARGVAGIVCKKWNI